MFIWTLIFLIITVVAGYFTFQKKKTGATQIAKIIFYTFLVLFVLSLILWLVQAFFHPSVSMKMDTPSMMK